MRKLFIASLIFSIVMGSATAFAKNDKNNNKERTVVAVTPTKDVTNVVPLTNAQKQLHGEWTIMAVHKKDINTKERAYIYLDFNGNNVYGSNGSNTINGQFSQQGNNISFQNMIQGTTNAAERNVMQTFGEVKSLEITNLNNIDYMTLKNSKGDEVLKLRRLNFDYINGPWNVEKIGAKNMRENNIRMVIDIDMLTIHVVTKCNIINGVVNIDPMKEREVQFEDLKSTHYTCSDIDAETEILINLEEVISCRKVDDNKVILLGPQQYNFRTKKMEDQELIVLTRLNLKK